MLDCLQTLMLKQVFLKDYFNCCEKYRQKMCPIAFIKQYSILFTPKQDEGIQPLLYKQKR